MRCRYCKNIVRKNLKYDRVLKFCPYCGKTLNLGDMMETLHKYKGYLIKSVYKHKFAVYQEGITNADTIGTRCGTTSHPDQQDKRISINFNSTKECRKFIDNLVKR